MCHLGWACGPCRFLRSVPLNALSTSTTAALGLHVRGHIPACSLYYLFMDLLFASLSDCFPTRWCCLPPTSSGIKLQKFSTCCVRNYFLICFQLIPCWFQRANPPLFQYCRIWWIAVLCAPSQLRSRFVNLNHNTPFSPSDEKPEPFWCLLTGQLPHCLDRVWGVPSATRLSPSCGVETRSARTTWNKGTPGLYTAAKGHPWSCSQYPCLWYPVFLGFSLAAAGGQASDPGELSAMALRPPAWVYLPVPHSASHRHVLDNFSRGVLPYIHLHWSSPAIVLPPLFWEFSSEGDWLSDHARLCCRQASGI